MRNSGGLPEPLIGVTTQAAAFDRPAQRRAEPILARLPAKNKLAAREGLTFAAANGVKILRQSYLIRPVWTTQIYFADHQSRADRPIAPPLRQCDHCASHAPRLARHVERPGGPARYLCRRCWLAASAAETRQALRDRVRREINALFAQRPRITRSRGAYCPNRTVLIARARRLARRAERRAR